MYKKLYIVLCLILGVSALSGCIEEYEADIPTDDAEMLVVEGTIISSTTNTFYLSYTQGLLSSCASQKIIGANVSVRGTDGSEYTAQDNYGNYTCDIDELNPDVKYYLHIDIDGEIYESEPQKPLRTEKIEDIKGVQNTPNSNIDILVTPAQPFELDRVNYYSWTYDETWEVHPDYITEMYFDTEKKTRILETEKNLFPLRGWKDAKGSSIMIGSSINYEGQHIHELKMYDISNSSERLYYKYSGLVHQRAITKAEYEYELARRQAGSEMGGLFTPQPSSLPTNIRCLTSNKHVIGFVGCSQNTSDYRFFLNSSEFFINNYSTGDKRIWLDDCNEDDCINMVERGYYLCEWIDERGNNGTLRTAWASLYQLDVRARGAYIEEPDYWDLNTNISY